MAKKTFDNRLWHEGVIGIPTADGKKVAARFWVKAYDEGSEYGIDEGKISKLTIDINGKTVCSYDRGWDIEPKTDEADLALQILIHEYN